jgi:hypothetical protein
MQSQIGVPKLLWDELENALMIKSKELIKDIAKVLRQDEKILYKEYRSKKTNIHLIEFNCQEDFECSAFVLDKPIAHKCRKPVLFGKCFCPEHEFFSLPCDAKNKPHLHRIQGEEPLFADTLTQQVYTVNYERVGYLQNNMCFVFEVEEG